MELSNAIRLNKFISDSGHCSRREADKLIEANRVKINGKSPVLGTKVESGDSVTVDGFLIHSTSASKADRVYIAYNKPMGITCTTEKNVKGNIIDAVDHDERIFPIGRLDKPSEGLILLTSDGDIVNKILRAENAHDKEYFVTVNKPLNAEFIKKMSSGVPILDTMTKPCKVVSTGKSSFKITLTQGLNRQIRRMCECLGYEVLALQRLRIMHIELGKLRSGQWRNLSREEIETLNSAITQSTNTSAVTKKKSHYSKTNTHSKRTASPSSDNRKKPSYKGKPKPVAKKLATKNSRSTTKNRPAKASKKTATAPRRPRRK